MKTIFLILTLSWGFSAANMVGGWTDKNVEDDGVQRIANFVVSENNKKSDSPQCEKLVEVINASTQIVAGINYRITFDTAPTICLKNDQYCSEMTDCSVLECAPRKRYVAKIWSKPWQNFTRITEIQYTERSSSC